MLYTAPFTRKLVLLIVVPISLSTLLLLGSFALSQHLQTNKEKRALAQIIENSLASLTLNYDHDPDALNIAATALLNIDPIINIAILNDDKSLIKRYGLPLNLKSLSLDRQQKTISKNADFTFIAIPVGDDVRRIWLGASLRNDGFTLTDYRGYLLMFLVGLCGLLMTLYFSTQLYNHIVTPLQKVLDELKDAITHDKQTEVSQDHGDFYGDLVDLINRLLMMQRSMREEMQGHVDQSTKELRETLETVEIQNIELDIARKNALHASRTKSEFLANTSHELRTPLNGIIGFTALLSKTTLTDQQKDYLGTIEKSAQGLLTVINDILDFSRLETGQLTLEYKPVIINELIEEIFSIYAPQAYEKNIRLLSIINPNVPNNLLGDPQRLKQVLSNLISNAIKFSHQGNIIVRTSVLGEVDNRVEIKFSVVDEGIGLSQEQQDNLFSTLSKIDGSDSRVNGGAGLGLAIAKGLVDKMKGEIGVESELNTGSDFWFTVRLGFDRQNQAQSPLSNSLFGLRCLVFDANSASRMELTHLLSEWGINVIEVDSKEKIESRMNEALNGNEFDFAVVDACYEHNNFNREKIVTCIRQITDEFHLPTIVLAPSTMQRLLQSDIVGFGSTLAARPINSTQLHLSICNILSIKSLSLAPGSNLHRLKNSVPLKSNISVLVVDDNPANRKLVSEFLKSIGTRVSVAEDGRRALEMVADERFDLILMDVQMPGMDGLETTRFIRSKESEHRTPIVALTAHAVNERKTQLLLSGMDDFLSKPVSEDDLQHIISRWVPEKPASTFDPIVASYEGLLSNKATFDSEAPSSTLEVEQVKFQNTPESPKEAVFNWAESMSLAKNKPDLATDMLRMLLANLDELEKTIPSLLASQSYDELEEVVHKFHGGCCYCGVPALRVASKNLELGLRNRSEDEINRLTPILISEIQRLQYWADQIDLTALFSDGDD